MSENVRMEINVKLYELHEFLTCFYISGKHTTMKIIKIWGRGKKKLYKVGPENSLPDTEDLTPFIFSTPTHFQYEMGEILQAKFAPYSYHVTKRTQDPFLRLRRQLSV